MSLGRVGLAPRERRKLKSQIGPAAINFNLGQPTAMYDAHYWWLTALGRARAPTSPMLDTNDRFPHPRAVEKLIRAGLDGKRLRRPKIDFGQNTDRRKLS